MRQSSFASTGHKFCIRASSGSGKRAELLAATEKELAHIAARVQRARSALHGAAVIGQAVGAVLGRRHMAKHFQISITDEAFSFAQDPLSIAAEAVGRADVAPTPQPSWKDSEPRRHAKHAATGGSGGRFF